MEKYISLRTTDTPRFINLVKFLQSALITEDACLIRIGGQTFDLHSPISFQQLGQLYPELLSPNNSMEGVAHPFPPSQIRNATTQNSTTLSPMMRLMQSPPPLRGQMTTTLSATNNEMMNCRPRNFVREVNWHIYKHDF